MAWDPKFAAFGVIKIDGKTVDVFFGNVLKNGWCFFRLF